MESQINEELADVNYIETMSKILKETVLEYGFNVENKDFVFRMLMGSILSFLYMPENDEDEIKRFVENILNLLIEKRRD